MGYPAYAPVGTPPAVGPSQGRGRNHLHHSAPGVRSGKIMPALTTPTVTNRVYNVTKPLKYKDWCQNIRHFESL